MHTTDLPNQVFSFYATTSSDQVINDDAIDGDHYYSISKIYLLAPPPGFNLSVPHEVEFMK